LVNQITASVIDMPIIDYCYEHSIQPILDSDETELTSTHASSITLADTLIMSVNHIISVADVKDQQQSFPLYSKHESPEERSLATLKGCASANCSIDIDMTMCGVERVADTNTESQ